MKKRLITSLLTLMLMIGALSPAKGVLLVGNEETNKNTSKKYEIYLQDVERVRKDFIKNAKITGSFDQAYAAPIGNINVANTAYFIHMDKLQYPNTFGIYDEKLGAFIVDCDHLKKIGRVYYRAYVIGDDDDAWYISMASGQDHGRMTYLDRTDTLKVYKEVTLENGVKHLKKWESISNCDSADDGNSRFYVDDYPGRYINETDTVGLNYDRYEHHIDIMEITNGKCKTRTINNVTDYYLAFNNVSYVLMNGNEVGYYDEENKKVVNLGKVNGQGTEIYVSKDCKTASVYNAQKQLVGTVNL